MKTIAQMLASLRLDLKDSGTVWSDGELTRCIERAVADYSRFKPRQMSREITMDFTVEDESFTTPTVSDYDYFVNAEDISGSSDGDTCTMAAIRPDTPRPVMITVTDANTSITQLVIIVKGYDSDNRYIEEVFYLEGGLVQTGQLYFALVTEVEIDEIAGAGASDLLDVGTGDEDGVYVPLANKPIKYDSEGISGYERDTDYEMDYSGGRIAMKDGGSMSANTSYTIDKYTKSLISIDLSTIIDDLVMVDTVEYPVGQLPQNIARIDVWGTILTIIGDYESQSNMADEQHMLIKYLTVHSAPNAQSAGSYPSSVETTIELAAVAYALFIEALQYDQQSVTDLASQRTALGSLAALHTTAQAELALANTQLDSAINATDMASIETALDAAVTALGRAATALGKVDSDGGKTYLTDADTALDAWVSAIADAATALAKCDTYLAGNSESVKALLAQIATDAADLRTAIATALDAANAALDTVAFTDVATYLTNAGTALTNAAAEAGLADSALDDVVLTEADDDLVDAENHLNQSEIDIGGAFGASTYLGDGDNFINTLNDGKDVPENYRSYAQGQCEISNARVNLGQGLVAAANARLNKMVLAINEAGGYNETAQKYINEAAEHIHMADVLLSNQRDLTNEAMGYIAEANARIANLQAYIEQARAYAVISDGFVAEAAQRFNLARGYIDEAGARVAIADRRINEATVEVGTAGGYVDEADGRVAKSGAYVAAARGFIENAAGYQGEMDRYLQEAEQYRRSSDSCLSLADKFREEAIERRNEAWAIWASPSQVAPNYVLGSRNQPMS